MPGDAHPIMNGPEADSLPREAGKLRLLSLGDLDQRTRAARHALALRNDFVNDFNLTSARGRELAQRASILGVMLEDLEARWLLASPVEQTAYATLVNSQRRVLHDIRAEPSQPHVEPHTPEQLLRAAIEFLQGAGLDISSLETSLDDSPQSDRGGLVGDTGTHIAVPLHISEPESPDNLPDTPPDILPDPADILSPENPIPNNIGERVLTGDRGAYIVLTEIAGSGKQKWAVHDFNGTLHSFKINKADAEELALTLPGI